MSKPADAPKDNSVQPATKQRPASYERRIKTLDDRQLLAEVQKQTKSEIKRRNFHSVALGTVLTALLESHIKGAPTLG